MRKVNLQDLDKSRDNLHGTTQIILSFIFVFFISSGIFAQQYQVIPVSGFNQDVIAEGVGTGSNHQANATTTITFDSSNYNGASHVMYAKNFRGDYNPSGAPPYGLTNDGFIISASNTNIRYQLANYTGNNVLRLAGVNSTGTLTFTTPGCYSALSILASSGQGSSTFNVTVNFTDGTSNSSYTFTVADWYGGSNYAILGIGRVNRTPDGSGETYDQFDGDASNPRLYDCTLALSGADLGKLIKSITITKNESGTGKTIILAVSGQINSSAPGTPTATAGTNYNNTSFTANWNAVDNTTSYKLDVSTDANFTTFVTGYNNLDVGYVTSKSVTGLSAGIAYFYRVRAANSNGQSFSSNIISVGGLSAPVATDATNKTSSSFSANWGSVGGTTSYKIDVATDFYFQACVTGYSNLDVGNVTTYSVTGLTSGVTYYYRVRATNASNTSMSSNIVSTGLPVPPVITYASNILSTSFTANWASVTATTYKIDVSTSSTFASFVGSYNNFDVGNVINYTVTGLSASTTYYYRVRSVNAAGSSVNSNVVTVLTQAATTNINLTATLGTTTANFTTLKAAFDAINAGTHKGAIVLSIIGNTTETSSAVLNYSGSGSASYTSILIRPQGGTSKSVTGSIAGALVSLNGADYVTIDGLNTGGNSLKFENTNTGTSSSAIKFGAGATYNTVKNCTLKGSNPSTTTYTDGVITFDAGSNNNNLISYCDIGPSGSNKPSRCIVAGSNNSSNGNTLNTVDHCTIHDFVGGAGTLVIDRHAGIYLYYGSASLWTITNNSFYQGSSVSVSSAACISPIHIRTGDGYTISGNYIGGTSASCGGTAMTYSGDINRFVAIELMDVATVNKSTISGNYIQNISFSSSNITGSSNSMSPRFSGIWVGMGYVDIMNNNIGRTDLTGNISVNNTGSFSLVYGICTGYSSTVNIDKCTGNTISGMNITGTQNFDAEIIELDGAHALNNLDNNTIGSTTTANSINVSGNIRIFDGICVYTSAATTPTCSGNTVQNITRSGSVTGGTNGMNMTSNITTTVSNSIVKNISSTSSAGDVYGMYFGTSGLTASGNTIDYISGPANIYGIYSGVSNPTIEKNFIKNLKTTGSGTEVDGIYSYHATNCGTIRNNIIYLGYDNAGASLANLKFKGINVYSGALVYFNTVYIGGTGASGNQSSYAFYNNYTDYAKNIRNNIFSNSRTNSGGSGSHYAIYLKDNSNLTCDYNDYYAGGTGGVLGYCSANKTNLAAWQSATSQDVNSLNTNPAYVNTTNFTYSGLLPTANFAGINIAGLTTDFESKTRGATPRMGALEGFIWKGTTSTDFNTSSNWLCNMVPGAGSSVVFDNAPVNSCVLDQDRTVASVINSQSTYILDVNGKSLTITGDISLTNGAKIKSDALNSTLIFGGTTAQTISSGAFGSYTVYNLTVNNSAGVNSNCDFTVSNQLNLTNGFFILGISNLTIGANASIGGTPSGTNMIIASGTGQLRKVFSGTGSFTYPIGDISDFEYTPITLNFTSGTFSSAYAGVNLSETKHPNNTSSTDYLNRYWTVSQSGISSFSCSVTCQYVSSDVTGNENNMWASKYDAGQGWFLMNQADAFNHRLTGTVTGFSAISGGQQGQLPVSMSSFISNVSGRDVNLKWITASETNNDGFEIQRKTGAGTWAKTGYVKGNGTKTTPTTYTFEDRKLNTGKYQYRLKQIDNNGNFEYHNLTSDVEISTPKEFKLSQNYPNPFNPVTNIDVNISAESKIKLIIYDITGREIKTLVNEILVPGYYTYKFDAANYSSGTYFCRMVIDSKDVSKSLINKMVLIK
ncbi:MAG: T9SS type A sorting domain-containing protein [Ignavibacteria bacterium]|nr:T9SS type A sorting domain-containing protein [Ignavibacteria bacterium]